MVDCQPPVRVRFDVFLRICYQHSVNHRVKITHSNFDYIFSSKILSTSHQKMFVIYGTFFEANPQKRFRDFILGRFRNVFLITRTLSPFLKKPYIYIITTTLKKKWSINLSLKKLYEFLTCQIQDRWSSSSSVEMKFSSWSQLF